MNDDSEAFTQTGKVSDSNIYVIHPQTRSANDTIDNKYPSASSALPMNMRLLDDRTRKER